MSTPNSSPTLSLIHSAFGPNSTLYTVLQCNKSSTSAELKRAYRKAALRYHPDRCHGKNEERADDDDDSPKTSSTAKFQAVSAAYQVLMDEGRRSVYDSTGRIVEEDDDIGFNDSDSEGSHEHSSKTSSKGKRRRGKSAHSSASQQQRQWENFFQSIFNEILTTGSEHATAGTSYRGSSKEKEDVLYYYKMCKGDMTKVVECILHGTAEDVVRWKREIVAPAVRRGEVTQYFGSEGERGCNEKSTERNGVKKRRRILLEDSSSDEDSAQVKKSSMKILGKKNRSKHNNNSLLVDTDDEEEDITTSNVTRLKSKSAQSASTTQSTTATNTGGGGMSKRDKMNYRVARKRKVKAEKEMELADIIGSRDWGGIYNSADRSSQSKSKKKKNMGGLSDALLSNIEARYGGSSGGNKKKQKKR